MYDRGILPEGSEFLPGTRLAEFLVEIPTSRVRFPLSYMDWLMVDYFSPAFSEL